MNKRDRYHQRFVEHLKFFQGQLVTTWPVLTEITHHVPTGKAVEVMALVRDGAFEVIELADAGGRIHDLMKKYADRPMDLADASLVWAAEQTGIGQVFTIDSDFTVFRLANGRRLQVLP
ncbi:MAG: type II toxin-antitoxin system VapC family toxin [Chromatiales bacterium]